MKKFIINIFTILAALAIVYSCQKEDWTYNGHQYYEFSASSHNQSFANCIFHKENAKIGLDSMCVQLIKTSNSEVTVNYKLVKEVYYLKLENRYTDTVPTGTKDEVVDIIINSAKSGQYGHYGDGKIFVSDISEAYTISEETREDDDE